MTFDKHSSYFFPLIVIPNLYFVRFLFALYFKDVIRMNNIFRFCRFLDLTLSENNQVVLLSLKTYFKSFQVVDRQLYFVNAHNIFIKNIYANHIQHANYLDSLCIKNM